LPRKAREFRFVPARLQVSSRRGRSRTCGQQRPDRRPRRGRAARYSGATPATRSGADAGDPGIDARHGAPTRMNGTGCAAAWTAAGGGTVPAL